MSELWSAHQREWLQAMGHTVLALAGSDAGPAPAHAETDVRGDERPGALAGGAADTPVRSAPARAGAAAPGAGRAVPAYEGGDSPLLRNLLRAARRDGGDPQVLALFDAQALRGNPAAKRALWPQLRGLRRRSARG
ncbi:alanine acetyltransferase [Lysobacter sp. CA199]|uniref:alanine acetyltransferase n=1 Tax=Lysobacter sp. CA199 TaxID=3455608 RepID=UPI003F8D0CEF